MCERLVTSRCVVIIYRYRKRKERCKGLKPWWSKTLKSMQKNEGLNKICWGESEKRWKGVSPFPSIGHQTLKSSKGHQTLEPSIGHQTLKPSKGHQTLEPSIGHQTLKPSKGHQTLEPSIGHQALEPFKGHRIRIFLHLLPSPSL